MIIAITGPTGVGKTKLSVMLAKKYNAIVINADATQIYKELNIGSAKITEEEKEGVEHFLFDIKHPLEDYSVADYQKDARSLLEKYKDRNIIVCGGTGLYLKALFNDYIFDKTNDIKYDDLTNEQLYDLAIKKDPNMLIHKNNRVRLINFLNKENITNQKDNKLYDVIYIGLTSDRSIIYDKVNKRVDKMFDMGLLEEVKSLYQKYPDSTILKRAIGYKEIIKYLNNEISLEEAKELIKKNTRHYVKRQYTWFNNQMDIKFFEVKDDFNITYCEITSFIESLNSK